MCKGAMIKLVPYHIVYIDAYKPAHPNYTCCTSRPYAHKLRINYWNASQRELRRTDLVWPSEMYHMYIPHSMLEKWLQTCTSINANALVCSTSFHCDMLSIKILKFLRSSKQNQWAPMFKSFLC